MTVVTANLANLVTVELDHVITEALGTLGYEDIINAIFHVTGSKKKNEYGQTVGGFALPAVKPEGEAMTAREFGEGYKTTYTHKTIAMYCPITLEAQQDELHGVIEKIPTLMSRAFDGVYNYYGSRIFTRATNATEDFVTGGDGVALLSASHPLKLAGGTSANTPSSGVDLGLDSFWTEVNRFYEMLDDQGKPIRNRPDRILIPHQLERVAVEILESQQTPESAENATNALRKRYQIKLVMWPYWIGATDSDCWFLLAAKDQWPRDQYPAKWYWRMKNKSDSYNDFFTKDFLYSLMSRFSVGYTDWRWLSGSMGA